MVGWREGGYLPWWHGGYIHPVYASLLHYPGYTHHGTPVTCTTTYRPTVKRVYEREASGLRKVRTIRAGRPLCVKSPKSVKSSISRRAELLLSPQRNKHKDWIDEG